MKSTDTTPDIYCYINQYGQRRSLLPEYKTATDTEKERAAVEAGERQREEWLIKALRAMRGEREKALKIIDTWLY